MVALESPAPELASHQATNPSVAFDAVGFLRVVGFIGMMTLAGHREDDLAHTCTIRRAMGTLANRFRVRFRWAWGLVTVLTACVAPGIHSPDLDGIEAFNRALRDATTRMDNAALADLWEEDGISLLPATEPLVGRKAILAMVEGITRDHPDAHMLLFEMRCDGMEGAGDLAIEHCEEHQRVDLGKNQAPFEGFGKMLLVLHRGADGKWRLRREMWNEGVGKK